MLGLRSVYRVFVNKSNVPQLALIFVGFFFLLHVFYWKSETFNLIVECSICFP